MTRQGIFAVLCTTVYHARRSLVFFCLPNTVTSDWHWEFLKLIQSRFQTASNIFVAFCIICNRFLVNQRRKFCCLRCFEGAGCELGFSGASCCNPGSLPHSVLYRQYFLWTIVVHQKPVPESNLQSDARDSRKRMAKTEDRNKTRMSIKSLPFYFNYACYVSWCEGTVQRPSTPKTFQNINFQELLYADDTLIIAKSAKTANAYLHLIEQESEYLHLMLNHDKCNYITFNTNIGRIKFRNGTMMKSTTDAKYLGAVINDKADPAQEIRRRISSTMPILKRLDIFWNKTNCSESWKLLVYNSVIISRLLYGLESLQTTDNTGKLLNTFQLKGLRKILHLHTTYVDRNNSNEFVYHRANEVVGAPSQGPLRKIRPLTEILETKRLKLLGHVLRRPRSHPQHQVTFASYLALPKTTSNRRVGRPRKNWTIENMKLAWNILKANG